MLKRLLSFLMLCGLAQLSLGYEGDLHQKLTFVAAKQFNRCVEGTDISALTPLQVRYIARANVDQAEANLFVRTFRWGYYDRSGRSSRSFLWIFDTRFSEHFGDLVKRIDRKSKRRDAEARRYSNLGRILGYVQDVTSPARAVPVYTSRFWRLNWADHFGSFPIVEQALTDAVADSCAVLMAERMTAQTEFEQTSYEQVLADTASDTLVAVQQPIYGMPADWQSFWQLSEEDDEFGEYGPAGNNFGRGTQFRCGSERGQRCVLLDNDPLYKEFALERHIAAVLGTMRGMLILQNTGAND